VSANHGNTPAAWTAVTIALAGILVGGIGLRADSMVVFWVGLAMLPVALVVGSVMSRMGYGGAR
jgi:hypothetical protein